MRDEMVVPFLGGTCLLTCMVTDCHWASLTGSVRVTNATTASVTAAADVAAYNDNELPNRSTIGACVRCSVRVDRHQQQRGVLTTCPEYVNNTAVRSVRMMVMLGGTLLSTRFSGRCQ